MVFWGNIGFENFDIMSFMLYEKLVNRKIRFCGLGFVLERGC